MAKGNHTAGNHSFRSGKSQATHVATQLAAHGTARHGGGRGDGTVKSIGSERVLQNDLAGFATWLAAKGESLSTVTKELAGEYLEHRAEAVGQSQLNSDRQSLDKLLAHNGETEKLAVVKSELEAISHNKHYGLQQVAAITGRQQEHNRLATIIATETGVRAHELLTLRPAGEGGQAADHRAWRPDRFAGRESDGKLYLVDGKGGLTREVLLSKEVAAMLEGKRLNEVVTVRDRGIFYQKQYCIGGGNAWSSSFTRASKAALGWSEGGHALRHSYVRERMTTLTEKLDYRYEDAREIVSNELGHFRSDILSAYGYP